jgi:hypothetical protein
MRQKAGNIMADRNKPEQSLDAIIMNQLNNEAEADHGNDFPTCPPPPHYELIFGLRRKNE